MTNPLDKANDPQKEIECLVKHIEKVRQDFAILQAKLLAGVLLGKGLCKEK
jgi:hypothetical protein